MALSIDTSDPGKAANVVARSMILFARISEMNAANDVRKSLGYSIAFQDDAYAAAVEDTFPELREKAE